MCVCVGHPLGWGSSQMETDVDQMLTAGVGLKAWGESVCIGCGGGAESQGGGCRPHGCTHTHRCWAGSGGQFPPSRCCPGRFSQPFEKGRGNYLNAPHTHTLLPKQKDEDRVNPHCFSLPSSVSFLPVCLPLGTPAAAGLDGAALCKGSNRYLPSQSPPVVLLRSVQGPKS